MFYLSKLLRLTDIIILTVKQKWKYASFEASFLLVFNFNFYYYLSCACYFFKMFCNVAHVPASCTLIFFFLCPFFFQLELCVLKCCTCCFKELHLIIRRRQCFPCFFNSFLFSGLFYWKEGSSFKEKLIWNQT